MTTASKLKITPGEWKTSRNPGTIENQPAFPSVRDSSGRSHGEDIIVECFGDSETVKANALLIAEAGTVANETGLMPREMKEQNTQMFNVLQVALATINRLADTPSRSASVQGTRDLINAAINRAEGRAS